MKKYFLFVLVALGALTLSAQNLSGTHHIKYLEVNTVQSDYGVAMLDDENIVFTSPVNEKASNSQQDLYIGKIDGLGEIVDKKPIGGIANEKVSRESATYSSDHKTVYFTAKKYRKRNSDKEKYQIYKATVDAQGNWTDMSPLPFCNSRYSFEHPSLNKDGSKLYFVSTRGSMANSKDIFVVDINEGGTFGEPVNLGETINTNGDEVTPYITDDNILYFSSNGREDSVGGLDVYAAEIFNTSITEPLHLQSPVNSINDDFAYILNGKKDGGYFASNRLQGQNNNDIYSFKIKEPEPEKCIQLIAGVVRDKETNEILNDAAVTLFDADGNQVDQTVTDNEGKYTLTLDCNNTYTLIAATLHHEKEEHIINTANYKNAPELEANKFLVRKAETDLLGRPTDNGEIAFENVKNVTDDEKETENKAKPEEEGLAYDEVALESVYFGFDRSDITEDSAEDLDKVAEIMKMNKTLKLEVSAYTDARGSDGYNQKLSNRRAQSTIDYLVSKGIDRSRITGKGYGEARMVNKCIDGVECSEAAHAKNRRTELQFLNP